MSFKKMLNIMLDGDMLDFKGTLICILEVFIAGCVGAGLGLLITHLICGG